ncbi:reverse transcriptase domain-containing protein [Tanacetum coccineum]
MSTNEQTPLSQPTSAVRNTLGKEQALPDSVRPISDEALREYYDKNYHQILPIIAEKVHQEKIQQEKLKAVKSCLNFEETSRHSESGTPSGKRNLNERLGPRRAHNMSESPKLRHGRGKEKDVSAHSRVSGHSSYHSSRRDTRSYYHSSHSRETKVASEKHRHKKEYSQRAETLSKSKGSAGGKWKSKPKKQKSGRSLKTLSNGRQDGTLSNADLVPHVQLHTHGKCQDSVEIHNIKQREGESTEEFVRRYKLECRDVKEAPECMKISRFMHGITHLELIKRLHDKIPKPVDEMMRVTTAFLIGEAAASNRKRKKSFPSWKQQEAGKKQNFKKGNFRNQQRTKRKQDRYTLLTKTPKEILALDKGKFKPPSLMTTPVEKRYAIKFCEFHGEVGHTTNECMHLKRQIEEMLKAGKLSHLIKELKQNNGKDHTKTVKKGETLGKDKSLSVISFPPLGEEDGTEGPMIIEADMGGHCVHRISPSPYNGIIGRPGVRKIQAIPSTTHEMLKFLVVGGIVILRSSKIIPLECSMVSETGSTLTEEGRKELCELLRRHLNVFSWNPSDMTGFPRYIVEHRLNIREGCLPVRQKKKGQAPKRNKAICEEVEKLVDADFKDLNKACPKDGYPLPEIDWKMESLWGYLFQMLPGCIQRVEAVLNLSSPRCLKDVQNLNGKLASLNRFLSKSAEKSLPFFKTLKKCTKKIDFQWTAEAEIAFKQMKQPIVELPMLAAPAEKEELIMYLAAAKGAIALQGPKINYTLMEKLILALTENIIKGQILADFIVERPEDDILDTPLEEGETLPGPWVLFTDGSSCVDGSRAGLIITNPEGMKFTYALRFRFDATNNEVEYEALIAGLRIARQMEVQNLQANLDSKLLANQVEEISHVLWAHRTMIKLSNEETPFLLTYGAEAVIPVEIGMPTLRTAEVDMIKNNEDLGINLDLLEEKREQATIQEARSKVKMEKYYNTRVRSISFRSGDLIYQNNKASHAKDKGKLRPKWEGPYEVTEALGIGAYKLRDCNGNILPRTWNICNLKNAMYMKCKHPLHARQSGRKGTARIFFICNKSKL